MVTWLDTMQSLCIYVAGCICTTISLVCKSSHRPVFDHLQFLHTANDETWSWGRPGSEATPQDPQINIRLLHLYAVCVAIVTSMLLVGQLAST